MEFQTSLLEPVSVICISGKFKRDHSKFKLKLETEIDRVLKTGCRRVLVNADIAFLDSVCLGMLIQQAVRVRSAGGDLATYSHQASLQHIFRVVKSTYGLFDSQEAALCYVVYGTVWDGSHWKAILNEEH